MQEKIDQLPTWNKIEDRLEPALEKMDKNHAATVSHRGQAIERELKSQLGSLSEKVSRTVKSQLQEMEQTLKARDTSEWKAQQENEKSDGGKTKPKS